MLAPDGVRVYHTKAKNHPLSQASSDEFIACS